MTRMYRKPALSFYLAGIEADKTPRVNILEWVSIKQRRVTKSTLAAETLSVSEAIDRAKFLRSLVSSIFARDIPLFIFSDNKSLVTTSKTTTTVREKGLIMDVAAIREGISKKEYTLDHIVTGDQLADCFTKKMNYDSFLQSIKTHRLPASVSALIVSHINSTS